MVGNGFPVLRGGKFIEQTNRFCNVTMNGQYQTMMTRRFFAVEPQRQADARDDSLFVPGRQGKNVAPIDYEKIAAAPPIACDRDGAADDGVELRHFREGHLL
jgi:hypothetical protein